VQLADLQALIDRVAQSAHDAPSAGGFQASLRRIWHMDWAAAAP